MTRSLTLETSTMMRWVLVVMALVAISPVATHAQEDYRSLDAGRPIRVTDAIPLKFMEWEVQLGVRGRWADERRGAAAALALEAGILRNTAFGIEIEPAFEREAGESVHGIESVAFHALHNIVRESWSWPAVALSLGADAPGGSLGRQDWGVSMEVVATRSLKSGLRLHANGGYHAATPRDGDDAWLAGLAVDYALGFSGRLLVADVVAEIPAREGRSRLWVEIGGRVQISNTSVLDLGLASRADQWRDGPNVELVLGLSRTFGIRSLTRVPVLPAPEIR